MDIKTNQQTPTQPPSQDESIHHNPVKSKKSAIWMIAGILGLGCLSLGIFFFLSLNSRQQNQRMPPLQNRQKIIISPSIDTSYGQPGSEFDGNIKQSVVVFEDNGVVLLNGLDSKPIIVDSQGSSPSFSPVLSKVVYVNNDNNIINVYDVRTGKIETINSTRQDALRYVVWSPNGKYFVTDAGTYVTGGARVYEYPSGKEITSFGSDVEGRWLQWDGNGNIIALTPQDVTPPRMWGEGQGRGIIKISLPSGRKQTLLQANAQYDYFLINVNNELIYYQLMDIKNYTDENNQMGSSMGVYGQINSTDRSSSLINSKAIPSLQIADSVFSNLPAVLSEYAIIQCLPNAKEPKWVLCSFYKYDTSTHTKIGLFNLNQPQLSVKIIADGNNPSW